MKIKKYGYRVQKAQEQFNRFIVLRDSGKPCASCGRYLPLCCGHFRSVGAAPELRFNEDNAHGQCYECNGNKSGNSKEYRRGLIERIGLSRLETLESYHSPQNWTVHDLYDIEKVYKAKADVMSTNFEYFYESA
ncbi:TPA: recombination protein NinG [Vibrio parahaemolyticus]|uniref:recombination protein NinG n=1 Tax=Vibrio parahaemolyticus TaxID=670 RepID=UPI002B2112EF|nr:recombination protein NinG [Vibrio parahaemolyticus]MEA5374638.1 recombination protein NinG [Vibrio parahaemolyticus]HCG8155657.1 recombination protein NinG [Vibrio parahaemolyticus]